MVDARETAIEVMAEAFFNAGWHDTPKRWEWVTEDQRESCRHHAHAVLAALSEAGFRVVRQEQAGHQVDYICPEYGNTIVMLLEPDEAALIEQHGDTYTNARPVFVDVEKP